MIALPNLARRPFVNRAPVRRTAVFLWLLAVVAVGTSSYLYWRHFMGLDRRQEMLADVETGIEREQAQIERHRARIQAIDLDWQNRQVEFLNERIAGRAFVWSHLFDRLSEVLPRDVRLERLSPSVASRSDRRDRGGGSGDRVNLSMVGSSRNQAALYDFVDAMFAHPAFRRPVLARETLKDEVAFTLSVTYLPAADVPVAEEAPADAPAEAEVAGATAAAPGGGA